MIVRFVQMLLGECNYVFFFSFKSSTLSTIWTNLLDILQLSQALDGLCCWPLKSVLSFSLICFYYTALLFCSTPQMWWIQPVLILIKLERLNGKLIQTQTDNVALMFQTGCKETIQRVIYSQNGYIVLILNSWKNNAHTSLNFLNSSRKCNMVVFHNNHYLMKKATLENRNTTTLLLWNLVAFTTFNKG